ncbi:RNA recognition motif family protein [Cryptosporidium serpentis]
MNNSAAKSEYAVLATTPNCTLYVNNLNDRVPTAELEKNLLQKLGNFGEIVNITCMKSFYRRGQAWITFKDIETASKALTAIQGVNMFNKPIRVAFAHTISYSSSVPAKRNNDKSLIPKAVQLKCDGYKLYLRQWLRHVKSNGTLAHNIAGSQDNEKNSPASQTLPPSLPLPLPPPPPPPPPLPQLSVASPMQTKWDASAFGGSAESRLRSGVNKAAVVAAAAKAAAAAVSAKRKSDGIIVGSPPGQLLRLDHENATLCKQNSTVFVEDIHDSCTEEMLMEIFKLEDGFVELRFIPNHNVAFVDFASEYHAAKAITKLNGLSILSKTIRLSFSKRKN